ncbi:MAG: ThiF family adenylyltransferase [Desulfobaccales bacterium]
MKLQNRDNLFEEPALADERLDRQVRIPGWNQEALARARVGVVGDDPWLTALFVVSAAALGVNQLTVVAPALDERLLTAARGLNPRLKLSFFPGYFSHALLEDMFQGCEVLIDLGHFALATKLLLNLAKRQGLPLVRGYTEDKGGQPAFKLFTYQPSREWREILAVLPPAQLPALHQGDPVAAMVAAGLVLEETKKLLLGETVTSEVISYPKVDSSHPGPLSPAAGGEKERVGSSGSFSQVAGENRQLRQIRLQIPPDEKQKPGPQNLPVAVVGAGALGNFVGLGLVALGFGNLTFFDPDPVEVTNLNRQILFWDAVGRPKAEALAEKIRECFGAPVRAVTGYVTRDTDLSGFVAVFDCTDNFESRIVLSEKCRETGLILISGGTGVEAGQVVIFDPGRGGPTPAELLGLYELVDGRQVDVTARQRASCVYAPEPAVIMTNQIIGGLMVDLFRRLLAGEVPANLFYDARGEKMF